MKRWCLILLLSGLFYGIGQEVAELSRQLEVVQDDSQTLAARLEGLDRLGETGASAQFSISDLLPIVADTTEPLELRRRAVLVLSQIGLENGTQADALFEVFRSPSTASDIRQTILIRFATMRQWRESTVPALLAVVENVDESVLFRSQIALLFLGNLEPTNESIQVFADLLQRPNEPSELQSLALRHLLLAGDQAQSVESILANVLSSSNRSSTQKMDCLRVLEKFESIDPETGNAVLLLIRSENAWNELTRQCLRVIHQSTPPSHPARQWVRAALFDSGLTSDLRARMLTIVSQWTELPVYYNETIDFQRQVLVVAGSPQESSAMRGFAVDLILDGHVANAESPLLKQWRTLFDDRTLPTASRLKIFNRLLSLPQTILNPAEVEPWVRQLFGDSEEAIEIKQHAARWLDRFLLDQIPQPRQLSRVELSERLNELQAWQSRLVSGNVGASEELKRLIHSLQSEQQSRGWERLRNWMDANRILAKPWVWVGAFVLAYVFCLSLTWYVLARSNPAKLFRLHLRLGQKKLPGWSTVSSSGILLCQWQANRSAVMDAWWRQEVSALLQRRQSEPRKTDASYFFEGNTTYKGSPFDLQHDEFWTSMFHRKQVCLVFEGPSGCGKSVWLKRLEKALIEAASLDDSGLPLSLPVFLNESDVARMDTSIGFIEGLFEATREAVPIQDRRLFMTLIEQKKICLICDGLDLWSKETRDRLLKGLREFDSFWLATALLNAGVLSELDPIIVQVRPLAPDQFHDFIQGYLRPTKSAASVDDQRIPETVRHLMAISHGLPIPPDLVAIYVDGKIQQAKEARSGEWPGSWNEVVCRFWQVRFALNAKSKIKWERCLNFLLHLAHESVQDTWHPQTVPTSRLESSEAEWKSMQPILEPELVRIDSAKSEASAFQFTRPSMARLLAAYGWMHGTGDAGKAQWSPTMDPLKRQPAWLTRPMAWLLAMNAIHDSCEDYQSRLPSEAEAALEDYFKNHSEDSRPFRPRFETDRLLLRALAPHEPDRELLIDRLRQQAEALTYNLPAILDKAVNMQDEMDVRLAALELLKSLQSGDSKVLLPLLNILTNPSEELFFRIKALDLLTASKSLDERIRDPFQELEQDETQPKFLRSRIRQHL